MPFLQDQLTIVSRDLFSEPQLVGLETDGFPDGDPFLDIENGFAASFADVDMDGAMVVAVEEESESIVDEKRRHGSQYNSKVEGGG